MRVLEADFRLVERGWALCITCLWPSGNPATYWVWLPDHGLSL